MAGALQPPAPVVEVGQLAVVDDGDVGERIGPVGVGVGDVDVGLGRHPRVADRVGADVTRRGRTRPATVSASPRSLTISSERPSESTSVWRTRSTASASGFRSPSKPKMTVIVRGVLLDLLDPGAGRAHPRLDLAALALHALGELGVARRSASLSFTCIT